MQRKPIITLPQLIIIVAATILTTTITVLAATGTTNATNAPSITSSYTLEDIYQRLTNGTTGTQSTFNEPAVAPGTGSMHDLNDIMSAAPVIDNTNGATANQVLDNQTFWGLTNSEWGFHTGNIPTRDSLTGANGQLSFNIPNGYYNNKTSTAVDANLIADNIRQGVTIFGITGNYKSGWGYYSTRGTTLEDIDMLSSTDAWAIQDNHAYHWDGISWSSTIYLPSSVNAVDMISTNDVWATGSAAKFLHWNGSSWSTHFTGLTGYSIYDIHMINSSNGWAVGYNNRIYQYDGSSWNLHSTVGGGTCSFTGLHMLNSTDGWAVDYCGRTFHWNGTSWSLFEDISTNWINAIDMINTSDGWIVGESGVIYHWNGTSWNLFADVGDSTLITLDMINSSDGWAAGENGEIYHYDGTYWILNTNAGTASINGIAVLSSNNGWAVNDVGEFYILRD